MRLKKIQLENIRTYENQEIEFPEGSLLLTGDIGSGKSSILLAVEFALFGVLRGKSGNSLLRNGEKEGKVRIIVPDGRSSMQVKKVERMIVK